MKKDYVCILLTLVRAKDVGATALRIYALLAAGIPALELAAALGVSARAVRHHLARLRRLGWLGPDGRPAAGGARGGAPSLAPAHGREDRQADGGRVAPRGPGCAPRSRGLSSSLEVVP